MKYLLFVGDIYYPSAGFNDFHSEYDTFKEAEKVGESIPLRNEYKWYQIVQNKKILKEVWGDEH